MEIAPFIQKLPNLTQGTYAGIWAVTYQLAFALETESVVTCTVHLNQHPGVSSQAAAGLASPCWALFIALLVYGEVIGQSYRLLKTETHCLAFCASSPTMTYNWHQTGPINGLMVRLLRMVEKAKQKTISLVALCSLMSQWAAMSRQAAVLSMVVNCWNAEEFTMRIWWSKATVWIGFFGVFSKY